MDEKLPEKQTQSCSLENFLPYQNNYDDNKNESREKKFNCNACDKSYLELGGLNLHIHDVHEGKRKYKCKLCKSEFQRTNVLKNHMSVVHLNTPPIKCNYCDKSIKESNLKKHIANSHKQKKEIDCKNVDNKVNIYQCDQCNKILATKNTLKKHIQEVHNKETSMTCDLCQKPLSSKRALRGHILNVHNSNDKRQCNICHKQIFEKCFEQHQRNIHQKPSSHHCELCNKTFSSKSTLNSHRLKLHGDGKSKRQSFVFTIAIAL